ncbi:Dorsal-ventral patterning protein Sog [Armadillidium vulgare]|nr:Dorsal-ventral patterning protein Sog [Armadillidium vulgare]
MLSSKRGAYFDDLVSPSPTGVMRVRRKRRIVAKVICNNVKTECPTELKCKKPVLYPGACCKICPASGKDENRETVQEEEINELEEDFLAEKDFAVVLNGRTSIFPVTTRRLATGRLFLRRGTLHFSFVKSPDTPSPSTIEFLDESGDVLEELESQPTPYETNNGRICGTWTRVPRQKMFSIFFLDTNEKKLLLKEKMWVSLTFDDDEDVISGRIARYKGVNTEVFSALLSRSQPDGGDSTNEDDNSSLPSGGTAVISVSAPSDSLHISLVFNGIFSPNDERNVTLAVELLPSRSLEPVQDYVILDKVFSDINEANVLTTLGKTSLRLLTRGKVSIKIWSTSAPELAIEGPITSRATCNVFYSVLTSSPKWNQGTSHIYGAGWGLLFLTNDGDFNYQIRLENLPDQVEGVVLDTEGRKRAREVEDVTHALSDGWVNGTYTKPTYRDLDALLRGRLRASVLLEGGGTLEGVFDAVSVTEALRVVYPTLLTSPNSWMAATAWAAVDEDCVMHYDVRVGGEDPTGNYDPTWSLQLRENDTTWDPRLDHSNVTLEQVVSGREIAAHTVHLTKISLSRLHHGVAYLDLAVSSSNKEFSPDVVLSAPLTDVVVPPSCRLEVGAGGYSEKSEKHPQQGVQIDAPCKGFVCLDEEIPPVISKKCIDDKKKVYEDGATWKSPVSNCARCMCTLGVIKCEDEPCPKPSCTNAVVLTGQCCPSCQGKAVKFIGQMQYDLRLHTNMLSVDQE